MTKKFKKELKKMPKRFMAFTMIFAMLFSYFAPITNALALSSTTQLLVSFRNGNEEYGKVQYSLNDGASWNDVTENVQNLNIAVTSDNLRLKIVPNNNYSVDYAGIEMRQDENDIGGLSTIGFENENGYAVPSNVQSVSLTQVEFRQNQNNDPEPTNPVGKITVSISGEELEYGGEFASDIAFGINDSPIRSLSADEVNYTRENNQIIGLETKEQIDYEYNYGDEGTVIFNIKTQWNDVITSLKINNIEYNTPQTKAELTQAYTTEFGGIKFSVQNVPYSEEYDIEINGRKQTDEEIILGNFGWTYDDNSNEYSDDDKIPNGVLEFVEAKYNNVTYDSIEDVNEAGGVFKWEDGVKGTNHPEGTATFPVGTELTIRLIPDTGYQLTSFDLNGFPFETGNDVGLYTFTIGGGNWHLGAHFTEVNDEVKANSQNVKSGEIEINKNNDNNFESGTAKLEVNDVVSMSPNRMEEFENLADEEGYDLENYLDISLYNTIYKGGNKDANGNYESWDTPVENIEDNATITLELEDDMSGKELAIIHEKHNGNTITGYELIDAVYNEENNTITFETDSFSNYAIVSKESTNNTKYTVHFDSKGESEVADKEVTSGNSVAEPTAPAKEGFTFGGWYEDETLSIKFDFNTRITGNVTLYAKWVANEDIKEYTKTDESGNVIIFKDEEGLELTFTSLEILQIPEEEIGELGITIDEFNQIKSLIIENTKNNGTLIGLYQFAVIDQNGDEHADTNNYGSVEIRILWTDAMEGYNTFKLININDDDFSAGDVIPLEVRTINNKKYLVGTLPHLSIWSLNASNTSNNTNNNTNNNTTNTTTNPQTGDNIYMWFGMLLISVLGLSVGTITATKFKKFKVK